MPENPIQRLIVSLPVFLLAIVLHEVAHGYAAYRLGDDTAKRAGRLTMSPIAHLDPIGTIMFVVSSLAGIGFGWAKPVPVVVERLRNPRRDDVLVTLAGPAANLLQAIAWALLFRWLGGGHVTGNLVHSVMVLCFLGVAMNVVLMVFNLLPIPPLDGSHVAVHLLGIEDPHIIGRLAPIGFIVLFLVVSTGAFGVLFEKLAYPLIIRLLGIPV
jgi:Zn-dependent protease